MIHLLGSYMALNPDYYTLTFGGFQVVGAFDCNIMGMCRQSPGCQWRRTPNMEYVSIMRGRVGVFLYIYANSLPNGRYDRPEHGIGEPR